MYSSVHSSGQFTHMYITDWCLRNSYIANKIRSLFQIIQLQLLVGLLVVLRLLLRLLLASLL